MTKSLKAEGKSGKTPRSKSSQLPVPLGNTLLRKDEEEQIRPRARLTPMSSHHHPHDDWDISETLRGEASVF